MIGKRIAGVVAALLLVVGGVVLYYINSLQSQSPSLLAACMQVERAPMAWACEQAFNRKSITAAEISQLNSESGVVGVLGFDDPAKARPVVEKLIRSGMDINAVHPTLGNTALHTLVSSRQIEDIRLLLGYGARLDVRDKNGRTPLEYAQELQRQFPQKDYGPIIALLGAS
jgi:ankyrin repeat protein